MNPAADGEADDSPILSNPSIPASCSFRDGKLADCELELDR